MLMGFEGDDESLVELQQIPFPLVARDDKPVLFCIEGVIAFTAVVECLLPDPIVLEFVVGTDEVGKFLWIVEEMGLPGDLDQLDQALAHDTFEIIANWRRLF
jgi:hypothetical protein